jgi:predicted HAD superfamily Cof-like phosphohydrolase
VSALKRTAQLMEFHRLFGIPILETPQVPSDDRVRLRMRMLLEETLECLDACFVDDHVTIDQLKRLGAEFIDKNVVSVDLPLLADGFGDVDYIVEGNRLEFGIQGHPIADAIHQANMAKAGPDGWIVRRADGKVLKPEGWTPPDIEGELKKQGWTP